MARVKATRGPASSCKQVLTPRALLPLCAAAAARVAYRANRTVRRSSPAATPLVGRRRTASGAVRETRGNRIDAHASREPAVMATFEATCTTAAGGLTVVSIESEVSTQSEAARALCRKGLAWLWSFHHEEAVRCFEESLKAAAKDGAACPLAAWGAAHCCSSDYNDGVFSDQARAAAFIRTAAEQSAKGSDMERALIAAETARIAGVDAGDDSAPQTYAREMKACFDAYPSNADVAAVFAHAVMMQKAWSL